MHADMPAHALQSPILGQINQAPLSHAFNNYSIHYHHYDHVHDHDQHVHAHSNFIILTRRTRPITTTTTTYTTNLVHLHYHTSTPPDYLNTTLSHHPDHYHFHTHTILLLIQCARNSVDGAKRLSSDTHTLNHPHYHFRNTIHTPTTQHHPRHH